MGNLRRLSALFAMSALAVPTLMTGVGVCAPQDPVGGAQLASRGEIVNPAAGVPGLPKNEASAWIIADGDTGDVLAAKDPHGQYLPASVLKTLTSITLIPKLNRQTEVRPTQETCDVTGTKVGMDPKMTYKVEDLFRALIMVSGNDAALALTQAFGGYKQTVDAMNAEAHRLQANDTVAGSPNGLDVDLGLDIKTQHTSVYDLALFMRQGLTLPDFKEYIATRDLHWPAPLTADDKKKGKKDSGYPIYSHDRLLPGEPDAYPGMLGGKNGYTEHSEQTFVGAARRNGHTIIIALMHSPSLWNVATGLLDWGFAADGKVKPIGTLVAPLDAKKDSTASPGAEAPAGPLGTATKGGNAIVLAAAAGGVFAIAAVGGGIFLARRRRTAAAAKGSGPAGRPGGVAGGPGGPGAPWEGGVSGAPGGFGGGSGFDGGYGFGGGVGGQHKATGGRPGGDVEDEPRSQIDPHQ